MSIITEDVKKIVSDIDFSQLQDKRVLVTGASGLIGVYMVACLKEIQTKYNIELYVWLNNPIEEQFSDIFNGCITITGDITNYNHPRFRLDGPFDYILHLAGYGQPNKFLNNKTKTIALNTTGTLNLFSNLNKNGKFLFASTSEVYSGLNSDNIDENEIGTTNTNHPRSAYIEAKRCGEAICYAQKDNGVYVKIARLSLAYGPGTKKDDTRVMNSLIQKGLTGESINLMDNGDAMRTYCYITDVVEMFWNIIFFGKETIYNVGGESKTSILELAKLIGDNLNKPVVLPEVSRTLAGNPKNVNISLKKYLNEFKKNNFVSLDNGVKKTIMWQKELYGKNNL
jgi:nucleoside-diphosphate-sugar epimerase